VHIYREDAADAGDAAGSGGEMQRSRTDSTAQTVAPGEDDA